MKVSNKILITTLLFIVFVGAAVHVTLYAKYKSGRFASEEQMKKRYFDSYAVPRFSRVNVTGLMNLRIITADQPRLEVNKNMKDRIHFELRAGTLFIWSDGAAYEANKNNYGPIMEDQETDLYMLPGTPVEASYCVMMAEGSPDSLTARDYSFRISNCRMQLGEFRYLERSPAYMNKVQISAYAGSEIRFSKKIDSLAASLTNSSLFDEGGRLGHLSLQANDSCSLSLSGSDLRLLLPVQ